MNDILNYKNYYASVHYSSTDEVFFGKILAINDLVTFEGDSVKALKVAFEEAVEDYLETCAEIGKVPDKTYKGTFNVRVSADLHKQAALFAAVHNLTLNDFVKKALAFTLAHKESADFSARLEEGKLQPA
ncbi:DNA repair protein [Pedobacter kyungheensis]|uniref:DNA repair protein n=1 Tax=Pedobacter kyungheensis TaxID=1069985 RepID=A0A0C1DG68_9SPHI|nr:type II toxin-antitoxin system HicB family antitoxin [Pedobacter kyungheensis]KIA96591.1 DNA repair protein [Pedobacter kyungheensis]